MLSTNDDAEQFGAKVQRAQYAIQNIRGVGTAKGIRVIVDAENRLLSVTVDEEASILQAYRAAVADKQPKLDDATREIRTDSRFLAVSTFAEANSARLEAERANRQRRLENEEDRYYEERNRKGWFDR